MQIFPTDFFFYCNLLEILIAATTDETLLKSFCKILSQKKNNRKFENFRCVSYIYENERDNYRWV